MKLSLTRRRGTRPCPAMVWKLAKVPIVRSWVYRWVRAIEDNYALGGPDDLDVAAVFGREDDKDADKAAGKPGKAAALKQKPVAAAAKSNLKTPSRRK